MVLMFDNFDNFDPLGSIDSDAKKSDQECTKKLAVALRYQPGKDYVPFVVAKGKCHLAELIIKKAEESNVPVVKSEELVKELFKLEVLEPIPTKLYVAVAEVLAFIQLGLEK
ncbi:MAG: EscU/YscU/HrcU family type III secretion system export apparatus switch protein [Fervidobacterium sp.]|uniref:EscU/YscU/HrcU family type III secretion system export apparatus switch protein n=1 Tax=Fervidobacterium sp. TaxID=1871331 RepID=UPI00404A3BA0